MKKLSVLNNDEKYFEFQSLNDFDKPIYFDNNSTTQTDADAVSAMIRVMEIDYYNPSSIHTGGLAVKKIIENARASVADFIGCNIDEIVFISGGTEGINTAIKSAYHTQNNKKHFITCKTEHSATLKTLQEITTNINYHVSYLDVDKQGNFNLVQLEDFLKINKDDNCLISLMAANNETGTLHNNIFAAIKLAHDYKSLFHVDAVQIAGKLPLKPFIDAGVDFLTISGHKFCAPKGIGALYIKNGTPFYSTIFGGAQENNKRGGTENVPGIIALGEVCSKKPIFNDEIIRLHNLFIELLRKNIANCIINGGGVPGTINVGFKNIHRESMVARMSNYGLYASVGSACSSGIQPSHVLKAMKISDEYLHGSVRFSMSKYTTEKEVLRAIEIIVKSYEEIRHIGMGIIRG